MYVTIIQNRKSMLGIIHLCEKKAISTLLSSICNIYDDITPIIKIAHQCAIAYPCVDFNTS